MRSRHKATGLVGQQDGQTVGHHDGAGQTTLNGQTSVSHGAIRRVGIQSHDVSTVNLIQKNGPHTVRGLNTAPQPLGEDCTVSTHRLRRIPHMITQVQTVKR